MTTEDQNGQPRSVLSRRVFLKVLLSMPIAWLVAVWMGRAQPTSAADELAPPSPFRRRTPVAPVTPTAPAATATGQAPAATATPILQATPECGDDDDETPAQTEGPYFTPNSPERMSLLEAGITGTQFVLTGYVVNTSCQPVAGALVDFWHADNSGAYDNVGYKLRGHQYTDAAGRFTLTTIKPGLYTGRTRHIHVKVQAPNQLILTTQLYFPGEAGNARDGIFDARLLMGVAAAADGNGEVATFTFVLDV